MKIDAHVHVFAKASSEFPRLTSAYMPAHSEAPVEQLLTAMETHSIDRAVLVQTGGTSLAYHAYLRHCLKIYPDYFKGIGLVDAETKNPAAHMDRLAADGRIIGFRLRSLGGPADPLAPIDVRHFSTYPIWQRAAEKDYVIWLYLQAVDAHLVPFILEAFPAVRVVFNHMMVCPGVGRFSRDALGRPQADVDFPPQTRYSTLGLKIGRIANNTRGLYPYENVCVHISGQYAFSKQPWPYTDLATWHKNLYAVLGADHLMWATDFPWIKAEPGYDKQTQICNALLPMLDKHEQKLVMGGTAQRFLHF